MLVIAIFSFFCTCTFEGTVATNRTRHTVTTVLHPPFVSRANNGKFEGVVIDVLDQIAQILNFDYDIDLADPTHSAVDGGNGSWNQMIAEITNGKADIAAATLTLTSSRAKVVDFSHPYMNAGLRILIKKPSFDIDPWFLLELLEPFSVDVWLMVILTFVVASLTLFLITKFSPYETKLRDGSSAISDVENIKKSFLFMISSLTWQGNKKLPSSISGRVLASFWWMFAMLTITIFIANSTAHFLTKRPMTRGIPFTTFEEMSRQTDVKFGIFDKGSTMQYFKNSRKPLIRRLWTMMKNSKPSVFIQDGEDYASKVLNSNGKFALIIESTTAFALARSNCNFLVFGERINEKAHGFACKKNTGICAQIDTAILEMQRRSSIYRVLRKWSPRTCSRVYVRSSGNRGIEPGIALRRFAAPLLILGVGFLLAAAVFIVEVLITGKRLNQRIVTLEEQRNIPESIDTT